MSAETERERILGNGDLPGVMPRVVGIGSDDLGIRDKRISDDPTLDAPRVSFLSAACTQANPSVITSAAHGFADEQGPFRLTTTDTLPVGFLAATDYYIVYVGVDTFQISLTKGGSGVACTDNSTTGTHTLRSTGQREQRDAGNAAGDSKQGHEFGILSTETDDIYA